MSAATRCYSQYNQSCCDTVLAYIPVLYQSKRRCRGNICRRNVSMMGVEDDKTDSTLPNEVNYVPETSSLR